MNSKTTKRRQQRPRPASHAPQRPVPPKPYVPKKRTFDIIERVVEAPPPPPAELPFRVLIAIHRPRFRGRAERSVARVGWEITSLLNKQDPVGQCAKAPAPPDVLLLSGDFGRQRNYAIFRAVQKYREQGMKIVGLVDDCEEAPEGYPDSSPANLCDICITPPVKTTDLRELFADLFRAVKGEEPPPLRTAHTEEEEEESEE